MAVFKELICSICSNEHIRAGKELPGVGGNQNCAKKRMNRGTEIVVCHRLLVCSCYCPLSRSAWERGGNLTHRSYTCKFLGVSLDPHSSYLFTVCLESCRPYCLYCNFKRQSSSSLIKYTGETMPKHKMGERDEDNRHITERRRDKRRG